MAKEICEDCGSVAVKPYTTCNIDGRPALVCEEHVKNLEVGHQWNDFYGRIRSRRAAKAEQAGPVALGAGGEQFKRGDRIESKSPYHIAVVGWIRGPYDYELRSGDGLHQTGHVTTEKEASHWRKLPPAPQQQGEELHTKQPSGVAMRMHQEMLEASQEAMRRAFSVTLPPREPIVIPPEAITVRYVEPSLPFPEYPEVAAYAIARPREVVPVDVSASPLAAFTAAVNEHLVPRLPKGLRVVTDIGALGFIGSVLHGEEEIGDFLHYFHESLDAEAFEQHRENIAKELLELSERG